MTRDDIETLANSHNLTIFGVTPWEAGSVVLLGPKEPGFWSAFRMSPEWQDQAPDPIDRWSVRVIGMMAAKLGAKAAFPFGAEQHPFLSWIQNSDAAWQSPVGMMVQAQAGLMVSYRGALITGALPEVRHVTPCGGCAQPCLTACPVRALTSDGYDVAACRAHVSSVSGKACMGGCQVRRSCPISQRYPRDPAQSAYNMGQFID